MSEHKLRLSYLILAIIIFSCGFLAFTYQQLPSYFKKDLISYDECTSAVVSANLYRDYFPPRLRLNALDDTYAGWKEGPEWQHIPPLFLYVPFPFMKMDREITIEVRRMSYVFAAYVQGLIFIIGIALLYREKRAILAATIAAWAWLVTPFVRQCLNGNAFGYSDIVLSFFVVLSFLMILGYMQNRFRSWPIKRHWLYLTILACTIPLLVKNLLGALPIAWLLTYVIFSPTERQGRGLNLAKVIGIPAVLCAVYYGINYAASPEAFRQSFLVSLHHFGDFEGWKRPWHYFLTNYLPQRYFSFAFWPFVAAFGLSVWLWWKLPKQDTKRTTGWFLLYFMLNLIAVSIVTSKSANFILQGYQFLLFFVAYLISRFLMEVIPALKFTRLLNWLYEVRLGVASVAIVLFGTLLYLNVTRLSTQRNAPYQYQTKNERFFQFGELCNNVLYANQSDLFILDTDTMRYGADVAHEDPDYWFRYYILFLSGSEARRAEEFAQFSDSFNVEKAIRKKYRNVYFVTSDNAMHKFYPEYVEDFTPLGIYQIMRVRPKKISKFL